MLHAIHPGTGVLRHAATLMILVASCAAPPADRAQNALQVAPSTPVEPADPLAGAKDPLAPKPWTSAFLASSVLLANDVRIEGPEGLLDHLYCGSSEKYVMNQRALPEGYEQTIQVRPGSGDRIRADLDGLRIEAFHQLVVMERVTPCDVRVTATGEAWWRNLDGSEERGDTWERTGAIEH